MLKFNSKALVRVLMVAGLVSGTGVAVAGTANSTVTVDATLVSACEVSTAAAIHFPEITSLSSAGDVTANSGTSFQVACSSDVSPLISTTATRTMLFGAIPLPFNLSLTAGAAADDFPATATGLVMTQDGTLKTVTLYGRVPAANFTGANAKAAGAYTVPLTVAVSY